MNKMIFLDFDGVLNTERYQNELMCQGKTRRDRYGAIFDPAAVQQLKRIIDATDAAIVIESSWKFLGLAAMQEMWKERGLPGKVVGITDSSVSDDWLLTANLDDADSAMGQCKGMEIDLWLSEKVKNNIRYVIIDDENGCFDNQKAFFVQTNPYYGITEDIANRAISILNR